VLEVEQQAADGVPITRAHLILEREPQVLGIHPLAESALDHGESSRDTPERGVRDSYPAPGYLWGAGKASNHRRDTPASSTLRRVAVVLWDPRWRWVGGGEYPRLSAAKPDLVLDRTCRLG